MIEAAIDIGTNTMLMLVADVGAPAKDAGLRELNRTLDDRINFVRLGQGVHQNRNFAPEAMERSLQCFREYRKICDELGVQKIYAVGTSASRDSANAPEFYARVFQETGIRVEIIDGKIEARLGFLGGLLPFQDPQKSVVLDIGGGSTEFVALDRAGKIHGQSLNIGSVRATDMFLKGDPYEKPALVAMEKYLKQIWERLDPALQEELKQKEWTGIAGTPTTLAALILNMKEFIPEKVDGYRLSLETVGEWYEKLSRQKQAERAGNPIMGPGRADVMVAGVAVLYFAMEYFAKKDLIVSSRGLRHGILLAPPAGA